MKSEQVDSLLKELGFLKTGAMGEKQTQEQNGQGDDLYKALQKEKMEVILAENLQNILLTISGIRDQENEAQEEVENPKWNKVGVYDEQTGIFKFRKGESQAIHSHFKLLGLNRFTLK